MHQLSDRSSEQTCPKVRSLLLIEGDPSPVGTFLRFRGLCSVSVDGWHRTRMNVDTLNPLLASATTMSLNNPVANTKHVKEEWRGKVTVP